jgi:hypothetical protein
MGELIVQYVELFRFGDLFNSLHREPASIHGQVDAGDVGSLRRGKKHNCFRNLTRSANTVEQRS